MPPRPRTPRPRATPSRRPRVAGLTPAAPRPAGPDRPSGPADDPQAAPAGTAPAGTDPTGTDPTETTVSIPAAGAGRPAATARKRRQGGPDEPSPRSDASGPARSGVPSSPASPAPSEDTTDESPGEPAAAAFVAVLRRRAVALLVAALVLLAGAAAVFGVLDAQLRGTAAARNLALVDVGATAEASGQLSDAIETIYSFDFARLDANENAAREVITPEFAAEFDRLFAEVRARAPEQQAVVSATVRTSAVKELSADRAVMVAFVDQQATRAAPEVESQQLAAAGRLTVTGERVDGRWKIAAVTPL